MLCSQCGFDNPENSSSCKSCSREIDPAASSSFDTTGWLAGESSSSKTSRLALASLGLGMISVFPPAGLAAVVLGHASLAGIRQSNGNLRGCDVARLALICGYLGLAIFSVVLLAASWYLELPVRALLFSTPEFVTPASALSSRPPDPGSSLNEMHAMNALLQVNVAETVHYHTYPELGYACDLKKLKGTGLANDTENVAAQNGYSLLIDSCDRSPSGKVITYQALAIPTMTRDARVYCTDRTGIIRTADAKDYSSCSKTGIAVK